MPSAPSSHDDSISVDEKYEDGQGQAQHGDGAGGVMGVQGDIDVDIEALRDELVEADVEDNAERTLAVLLSFRHLPASQEMVQELLSLVEHAEGKAALHLSRHQHVNSSSSVDGVESSVEGRIVAVAGEVRDKWVEAVLPGAMRQYALDTIVLPQVAVRNKTKSYALIKARLRDAGLPTGGKKRKILQRLKALDEKEAHLHAMQEEAHQNETRVDSSRKGGGGDVDELVDSGLDSYEPSQVDDRFAAIYTDPEFALDPTHERFSLVKGRSHVAQKRFTDLKRLIDRDHKRR
jgi:hypothetical protein